MALDPRWPVLAPPGIAPLEASPAVLCAAAPATQAEMAAQMQLAAAAMEMQVLEVQARAQAHLAQAAHLMMSLPQHRRPEPAAPAAPWPGAALRLPAPRRGEAAPGPLAPAERGAGLAPPRAGGSRHRRQSPAQGTLRNYLQETRAQDPRCVFVVRRINKLGFRSKAVLERHYSRFGEVARIMVSHQQAKRWANQASGPRTRPGNFGLVVMKSQAAAQRILEQGPEQVVGGVAIQVLEFQAALLEGGATLGLEAVPEQLERALADAEPREPPRPGPPPGLAADGAAELPGGVGGEPPAEASDDADEVAEGPAGQMPRQASEGAEVAAANASMPRQASEESAVSGSSGCTRNSNDTGLERDSGNWGSGASCNADEECSEQNSTSTRASLAGLSRCFSALGTITSASSSSNSFGSPGDQPRGSSGCSSSQSGVSGWGRGAPEQSSGDLVAMLNELGRIAKDPQRLNNFTQEQSASAASLAQWAQRSLANLEQECCCRMEQLLLSSKGATPSPPGLEADAAAQQGRPPAQQAAHAANTAADASSAAGSATSARKRGARAEHGARGKAPAPGSRSPLQNPGTAGPQNDTLRSHLTDLLSEDPNSIFITRRINKLGFCSREILKQHYSKYGKVLRVLVATSKVKPFRDARGQMRTRPGGLGLIVMQNAEQVRAILAAGEEQDVSGHQIRVQCFERPQAEEPWGAEPGTSGDSGASTATGSTADSGSGSGGGSRTRRSQGSGSAGSASNGSAQGSDSRGTPKETSGSDGGNERQASGESEGGGSGGM